MALTTNPATVRAGRVRVSCSSTEKRAALIGRLAWIDSADGWRAVGRITDVVSNHVIVTLPDGRWWRSGSVVELADTQTVVDQDHALALLEDAAHDAAVAVAQPLTPELLTRYADRPQPLPRAMRYGAARLLSVPTP